MDPKLQRIAMAELHSFVWYKERNGNSKMADYWGVTRLAWPPQEGIAFPATYDKVSGTRYATPEEIEEAKRTGGFYTYAPEYLSDLNAVHEVEKLLTKEQTVLVTTGLIQQHMGMTYDYPAMGRLWHASATQRVEAILRATNRWTD